MSLAEIQQLFWRAITWPTGIDDFLAQTDASTREAFERTFAGTKGFEARERMQVYAEAYFWRLFEVLREQFERTAWLCGPDPFHDLVTDYLLAQPSTEPDISLIGRSFPAFVESHPQERRRPGLSDVARLEWQIFETIDREDEPALAAPSLASVPLERWPQLRFIVRSTTHLVPCRLPFSALAAAHERGEPPPSAHQTPSESAAVLVWREGFGVLHRTPSPAEARALASLVNGRSFAEICDAAAGVRANEATPQDVVRWLHRWLRAGLVRDVRIDA